MLSVMLSLDWSVSMHCWHVWIRKGLMHGYQQRRLRIPYMFNLRKIMKSLKKIKNSRRYATACVLTGVRPMHYTSAAPIHRLVYSYDKLGLLYVWGQFWLWAACFRRLPLWMPKGIDISSVFFSWFSSSLLFSLVFLLFPFFFCLCKISYVACRAMRASTSPS